MGYYYIHKSQGLLLHEATIDIGKIERKRLTFATMPRVEVLDSLHIQLIFTFDRYSKIQNNPYTIYMKKNESCLN